MKRGQLLLGLCLVVGGVPACGGGGGGANNDGGSGASAMAGSGGAGGGGGSGVAGSAAGSAAGGESTAGSGGKADGGSSTGGGAGMSGGGGTSGADDINCIESDRGCICSMLPPQPNDAPICTAVSVGGQCCKSEATGFCSCREWSCENDNLGCSCGSSVDGPLSKCTGSFGVCCLSVIGTASNCYCDDILTECVDADDMKVANCDIAIAPCGEGEVAVDACKP